jgi:two-component system chemotaxis response regulator CheY
MYIYINSKQLLFKTICFYVKIYTKHHDWEVNILAKVLVVDDSSIIRRNLSSILKKAGHTIVAEAPNGEIGVKEYERHKPELVTMDITMPVLDGIEAVKKIISFDPEAKIVMISALDQRFMVLTALQSGAKHYVIKPFSSEKVLNVIDEVLTLPTVNSIRKTDFVRKDKPPKQVESFGLIDNTITDINQAINCINTSLQEIDAKKE